MSEAPYMAFVVALRMLRSVCSGMLTDVVCGALVVWGFGGIVALVEDTLCVLPCDTYTCVLGKDSSLRSE